MAAYDLWNKPIGLLYLSSILKKNNIDIDLIDLLDRFDPWFEHINIRWGNTGKYHTEKVEDIEILKKLDTFHLKRYGLPKPEFEHRLTSITKPDLILLTTGMTYWYLGVIETAKILKKYFPDTPIIVGGNGVILDKKTYLDNDFFYRTFDDTDLSDLYNFIEDRFQIKLNFKPIKRSDYPLPDWNIYKNKSIAAIQTSWGCPYHCTYCASNTIYPSFYQKPPEETVEELEYLKNLGVKDIAIYDDAILVNSDNHFNEILRLWDKKKGNVQLHLPNAIHPHLLTEKTAKLMFNSNVSDLAIGYDTLSVREKQTKKYPLKKVLRMLHNAGYKKKNLWVYLLVGLPSQSYNEIATAMEKIADFEGTIKLAWFSPIPGTPDFNNIKNKKEEPFYYNSSLYSILSGNFSLEEVENLKKLKNNFNRRNYA